MSTPTPELLEKISQQVQTDSLIVQTLLQLEVDLAVLSKEQSLLAALSSRIDESCRALRLSLQEQELRD